MILWDEGLRKVKTFSILDASPLPVSSALHSVCTDPKGMKILAATKSGDLYEVSALECFMRCAHSLEIAPFL